MPLTIPVNACFLFFFLFFYVDVDSDSDSEDNYIICCIAYTTTQDIYFSCLYGPKIRDLRLYMLDGVAMKGSKCGWAPTLLMPMFSDLHPDIGYRISAYCFS